MLAACEIKDVVSHEFLPRVLPRDQVGGLRGGRDIYGGEEVPQEVQERRVVGFHVACEDGGADDEDVGGEGEGVDAGGGDDGFAELAHGGDEGRQIFGVRGVHGGEGRFWVRVCGIVGFSSGCWLLVEEG